jgi:hypothetical protein
MPEKRGRPWKPILIIIAAGLVLSLSSCFGLTLAPSGTLGTFLLGALFAGATIFMVGVVSLVVAAVLAMVFGFWKGKP